MDKSITGAVGSEREETNRRLVLDFYENVIIDRQFDRRPRRLSRDHTARVVRSMLG
jgi:hypothetical protein